MGRSNPSGKYGGGISGETSTENPLNTINNKLMNLNRTGQEVEKVSNAVNASSFDTHVQSNKGFAWRSFQGGKKVVEDGQLSG